MLTSHNLNSSEIGEGGWEELMSALLFKLVIEGNIQGKASWNINFSEIGEGVDVIMVLEIDSRREYSSHSSIEFEYERNRNTSHRITSSSPNLTSFHRYKYSIPSHHFNSR